MIRNTKLLKLIRVSPKTVIHIGANKGQDRSQYILIGVKRIYWGEAFPPLANQLQKKFPSDQVIYGAFTNKNTGYKTLHVSALGTIGSRKLKIHETNFTSPNKTLDQEFGNLELVKPILLVIDTDGAELEILEGGKNFLKHVKWLVIEQYWTWDNGRWHTKLTKLASDYGFKRVFGRVSYTNDYEDVIVVFFSRFIDGVFYVAKQIKHMFIKGHISSTYFHCFKCE